MKKALSLCCFALLAMLIATSVSAEPATDDNWFNLASSSFASGSGTSSDPYIISTPGQLAHLAVLVNEGKAWDKYYALGQDIDLSGKYWLPIGTYDKSFFGHFDGMGHSVRNLVVRDAPITQVEGNIWHTQMCVAGLFGENRGTIENLSVTGSISIAHDSLVPQDDICAGGITGINRGIIRNCHSSCTITASSGGTEAYVQCGGIAGLYSNCTIDKCSNSGTITGTSPHVTRCGGIGGDDDGHGAVMNCWNTGAVYSYSSGAGSADAGGITQKTPSGTVENCFNTGTVYGDRMAGGIMSYVFNGGSIRNCYNTGAVTTGSSGQCSYGIAEAEHGSIRNCYWLEGCADSWGSNYNSSGTVENIHTISDGFEVVYVDSSRAALLDKLNEWVSHASYVISSDYCTWIPSENGQPVLAIDPPSSPEPESTPYHIAPLSVRNASGIPISSIPAGDFWASVPITKTSETGNANILLAAYDKDGKFIQMFHADVSELPQNATVKIGFYIKNSGNVARVKAFAMSSFSDLTPLAPAVEFPAS